MFFWVGETGILTVIGDLYSVLKMIVTGFRRFVNSLTPIQNLEKETMYKIMFREKKGKRWLDVYFQNMRELVLERTRTDAKLAVNYFSKYSPSRTFKAVKIIQKGVIR